MVAVRRLFLTTLTAATFAFNFAGVAQAARDLAGMSADETIVLQRRLTDAGCFKGNADGKNSAALDAAVKACPDQEPVLRIETGMHVAVINRIDVDARCSIAATGSDDKTVRLWSMPDGRLLRTQRLPIGEGNGGKVYAVAVSPDGKWVAAGGWIATDGQQESIYLFDTATGGTVRRLGAFGNVVLHIGFSPDGSRIAAALSGGQGVRVLDVASGRELSADRDFDGKDSYHVSFTPDGGLVATGYDGALRRYAPDGRRIAKVATRGGKRAFAAAFDPSGQRVAVGFDDTTTVDLYNAEGLPFRAAADTGGTTNGDLSKVGWSADGRRLYAGGRYRASKTMVRVFTPDGKRIGADLAVSNSTIMTLLPCGGAMAFAAADPTFGLIAADGAVTMLATSRAPDMRNKTADAFTVSDDGRRVRFGLEPFARRPVLFDLAAGTVADSPSRPGDLHIPDITDLPVTDWQDKFTPRVGGTAISIEAYESSRALAIRPDGTGFALGADFRLRSFDAAGTKRWQKDQPGVSWGINLARGGDLIVVAYRDGTIRWHRWSDGAELLALFVNKDTHQWVTWTPTGYYNASPGAEDMIGWHVNRGWEQPADFFPASRFRERFYRPDIVSLVLDTMDEPAAIRQANLTARKREDAKSITAALPPVVTILSPSDGARIATDTVEIAYSVRSPSGLPVDRVDVLVDGARQESRGLAPAASTSSSGDGARTLRVPMPARDATVALVARSGDLSSTLATVRLAWSGATPAPTNGDILKPSLYALVIGVSDYATPALKLNYAAKDARDLGGALRAQAGGLYRAIDVEVMTDRDATSLGVKEGLLRLSRKMTSRDLALVFLAGHGVTDAKGKFWFLTQEGDPDKLLTTAVSRDDIMGVVADLPGKKLVFFDACHSGAALGETKRGLGIGVDVSKALNDFALGEDGVIAFSSSTGREFSIESDAIGNGAFTKALVEAIGGKADLLGRGTITLSTLDAYVLDRVKDLTGGRQHPMMVRPPTLDYPVALRR